MGVDNLDDLKNPDEPLAWPNQDPIIDGVVPTSEVDQSPDLFKDDSEDLEMEDPDAD